MTPLPESVKRLIAEGADNFFNGAEGFYTPMQGYLAGAKFAFRLGRAEAFLEVEANIAMTHAMEDKAKIPHLYELGTWCHDKAMEEGSQK